jgi:hypothetical protein
MSYGEILEKAVKKAGTQRELGTIINQHENAISEARKGKRGLPDTACLKLAQFMEIDFGKVIAARNEWTAKSEEERKIWLPLVRAAGIAALSIGVVTSFLTPSPAEAAPHKGIPSSPMCIM